MGDAGVSVHHDLLPATAYEPGARPASGIPLCIPEIRGNEWAYVRECLDTGWVSSVGPFVTKFEESVARSAGKRYAVATVNGTAALHIALICAGVEAGDAVLVSDLTFIAPANAIRYIGANPVFIDAEPTHWQIDPDAIARYCAQECTLTGGALRETSTGRRVRAILPVSILGHPVDLRPIREIAERYRLALIEDATESLGTTYGGKPAGASADISCFSFNGNKLVTSGGGGMLCTDDAKVAQRARYLTTQAKDDPVEYAHGEVGYNYRLTNIQAAIGLAQIEMIDDFVAAKRAHARTYNRLLADIPGITLPREAPEAGCTFWLYTVLIDDAAFGMTSRDLLNALGRRKIQTRPLWQPMHRSAAHLGASFSGGSVADELHRTALSLPSSVGLTEAEQLTVIEAIKVAGR